MRIGELAEATGVSVRSLRYYEAQGLITSTRCGNGWRDFPADAVERVVMIQHLLAAGLCTTTIDELLPCLEAPAEERTGLLEHLLEQEEQRLVNKRRDLDREIDILRTLRADTSCSTVPNESIGEGISNPPRTP